MNMSTTIKGSIHIRLPEDCYALLRSFAGKPQEHFICLTLNSVHEVIKRHIVTIGLVNRTIVHPREVFRPAIADNASAVIVAHNHPSGIVFPSDEDNEVTARLADAAEILGIQLLDHVILGRKGFYSYSKEKNILNR